MIKAETIIANNEDFRAPRQLRWIVSSVQKDAQARAARAAEVAIRLPAPAKVTVVLALATAVKVVHQS